MYINIYHKCFNNLFIQLAKKQVNYNKFELNSMNFKEEEKILFVCLFLFFICVYINEA